MRKAGTAMSLGVTAPLAGIATAAISSAADFEQSMNVMAQVTGATGDQMATLQAQALNLGAVTSFSAGEAAEAMLELGKAGLAPDEIMGAIAGTMDLAAAGGLDLAQAATIAANAMNAFQLPAEKVTDVANMLAAAANASSVDVTDLAAGVQMAGAVFASNGQSVEALNVDFAEFVEGVNGSLAIFPRSRKQLDVSSKQIDFTYFITFFPFQRTVL
jgi:TP901 family phage tail tape measure protein